MRYLYARGTVGDDVVDLKKAISSALGPDASIFQGLSSGNQVDADTESAIRLWQSGTGLIADGIVGPRCLQLLGLLTLQPTEVRLELSVVSKLFPATKPANIERYLPYVAAALRAAELTDLAMILVALATVRAESEGFLPISEFSSPFNTTPGGAPFDKYEGGDGNRESGDGARFRGRGFVQIKGRSEYQKFGDAIGIDLTADTSRAELANAPEIAALLLAVFLRDAEEPIRTAVEKKDYAAARPLVNGGSYGIERFKDVFTRANELWPLLQPGQANATPELSPSGSLEKQPTPSATRPLNARRDAPDIRDRPYVPQPVGLAAAFPDDKAIEQLLPKYTDAKLILDQGQEGACTGFGLACVINYLRWREAGTPSKMESVSPRMLYTYARRYDEYEGESYEWSSCRGAIKGWFHHGVCQEDDWPYHQPHAQPQYGYANRAAKTPLGVYFRIDLQSITDLQAAIQQVGAVYVSCLTHEGWSKVPSGGKLKGHADLPVIEFDGRPSQVGGHAFALVGFNQYGFVLQNSWGAQWGASGFAILSYADWLANGMDAWVVALGVPGVIAGRISARGTAPSAKALSANTSQWWSEDQAYQHSVVFGNDGRMYRYLTEDEMTRTLLHQVAGLPDLWFRTQSQEARKRLVIIVHGGLNNEADGIKRARALGRHFLANGCYPLFVVWKTGIWDSIQNIFKDAFSRLPAGKSLGERITDQSDLLIEKTIGRPLARPIWSEIKENASYAFGNGRGGNLLITALQRLQENWGDSLEVHLVGHSAGAIWLGHFLNCAVVRQADQRITSTHLYAPACSVNFANQYYATNPRVMNNLYLDVLSDRLERDDQVAMIYRKSLLYLVSNALEKDIRTPLLGLSRIFDESDDGWDGTSSTNEDLGIWRRAAAEAGLSEKTGRLTIFRDDEMRSSEKDKAAASHGGFDNDLSTVRRTLERIVGRQLPAPPDDLGGY